MGGGSVDGIDVAVHVRPGARTSQVGGEHGGALAVKVSAPPVDGKANDAVCEAVAAAFGVRRGDVEVLSGHTSRQKRLRVLGDPAGLRARLAVLLED